MVYPAAGFAQQAAARRDCYLMELNIDRTEISSHFHEHLMGPVSVELPKLVDSLLA